jgi:hypothetical protein
MSFVLFSAFSGFAGRKKNFKEIGNAFQVKGEMANVTTSALLSSWLVMFPVSVFWAVC